jgi:hypothetical protein
MRIELETLPEDLRSHHPVNCGICDGAFYLGPVIAHAYCDDGVDWREVCPTCLAGGPDGMVETLRRWAAFYAQVAEDYAEVAAEGFDDVPTLREMWLLTELLA